MYVPFLKFSSGQSHKDLETHAHKAADDIFPADVILIDTAKIEKFWHKLIVI